MSEPSAIGEQLKRLRSERGLSQAELAERADLSVDVVAKLEQGARQTARMTTLARLAHGLDVDLGELLDRRPRMDRRGAGAGSLLAVRDALLSPDELPGIDRADDTGAATPAAQLNRAVRTCWEHYFAGRFGSLAAILPGLIGESRVTLRAVGSPGAAAAAQAHQLAACLMVHMGKQDMAAIGAERALAAALRGDDELQWATLHGTYAWVLLAQGRLEEAERHAARVAERIEPVMSKTSDEHVTVWGGLLITALAAAAAAGRKEGVGEYVSLARAGAARFESDRHDYWVSFGPVQVATQEAHAYTMLGQPARALRAARSVRRDQLLRVSYGRHLLDVAQAQFDAGRDQDTIAALYSAQELSAEWFRHQVVARAIVADLVNRQRRLTPAVRALVRAVELNPDTASG